MAKRMLRSAEARQTSSRTSPRRKYFTRRSTAQCASASVACAGKVRLAFLTGARFVSSSGGRKDSPLCAVSVITTRMKSIQTGKAACAPVSFSPRVFFSSNPIHTPQVRLGEKPINQASVKSLVVPVFPARGYFNFEAAKPVPIHDVLKQRDHDASSAGGGHIFCFRIIFFQN